MRTSKPIRHYSRGIRICAAWSIMALLCDVLYPTAAWALTSGPSQPEFTSFEPVVTSNMVNEFSGDLVYNLPVIDVPGPDGSGYSLSLSYHSGAGPEEEASWVGHGWTLNPGALNRQLQGFPDDWNGSQVKSFNQSAPSRTVSVSGVLQPEAFSYDIPVSTDGTIRYNNYNGFGYTVGAAVVLGQGIVSLGFHVSDGEGSFSLSVNPMALLHRSKETDEEKEKAAAKAYNNLTCENAQEQAADRKAYVQWATKNKNAAKAQFSAMGSIGAYSTRAMSSPTFPLSVGASHGNVATLSLGLVPTLLPLEIGLSGNVSGRLATVWPDANVTRSAYGYLHTPEGLNSAENALDYHVENPTTYNKRDKFLPLAVNDADLFVCTGEGIGGSMRFYNDVPGRFRPAYEQSETTMEQIGGELNLGLNTGGSVDAGIGHQQVTVQGWMATEMYFPKGEPSILRMANDKGGWATYDPSDAPRKADINTSGIWGFQSSSADDHGLASARLNAGGDKGRSSHVGYHTNAEMVVESGGVPFNRYEKRDLQALTDPEGTSEMPYSRAWLASHYPDLIGEVSVLNPAGQRYTYGLPVFAGYDTNINFAPTNNSTFDPAYSHNHFIDNDNEQGTTAKSGQESKGIYASSFLLTSITSPDYIDRSNNGPSPDDFGGYTSFSYSANSGNATNATLTSPTTKNWYWWRMPGGGFIVDRGSLSECHDDRASYSGGAKEVYYLNRVETKSHVAVFDLGERPDGLGAQPVQLATGYDQPRNTLSCLARIRLFKREEFYANVDPRPIKTVHFEYEQFDGDGHNKVWPLTPNSSGYPKGRLTLKRVWSEYNSIVPAAIAPYEFEYNYPDVTYPITGLAPHNSSSIDEEPNYDPYCTDTWGNYRPDGAARGDDMAPWNDQSPPDTWDPAAHQLKLIRLPSGGEIHVQYEADDYLYVQGDRAHVMARLAADQSGLPPEQFRISLTDLGLDDEDDLSYRNRDAEEVAALIRSEYVGRDRRIYFKHLYQLHGSSGLPDLANTTRNKEYITGYAIVTDAEADDDNTVLITLKNSDHALPRMVCEDLFNAEKRGKSLTENCTCTNGFTDGTVSNTGGNSAKDIILGLLDYATTFVGDHCVISNPEHSYFRIPVARRKLGGGLRVHRLLMYDPQGAAEGYPAVYGEEYIYRKLDERGLLVSSGVATNEPGGLREENVLVRPLDRLHQSLGNRAISGRDTKQTEGPIGFSLYPGASVGYSQVIVRNIATGKTRPAFSVKNFMTAKEHPIRVDNTEIEDRADVPVRVITGLVNIVKDHAMTSQGYTVTLNDMHGQPKRQASYFGEPGALLGEDQQAVLVSSMETEYFGPQEQLPIMVDRYGTINTQDGNPDNDAYPLGKESDLSIETRTVTDELDDATVEADFGVSMAIIVFPSFSFMVSTTTTNSRIDQHTITKVISRPAFVKRTKVFKDGIYSVSQNIAFDPATGEPLITRTHDGFFDGDLSTTADLGSTAGNTYTAYVTPASMVYPAMGQASKGEGQRIYSSCGSETPVEGLCITYAAETGNIGRLHFTANTPQASVCNALNKTCIGDLLEVRTRTSGSCTAASYMYNLVGMDGADMLVERTGYSSLVPNGCPVAHIGIIRSGCANQLDQHVGGFTLYGTGTVATDAPAEIALRYAFIDAVNAWIKEFEDHENLGTPAPDPELDFAGPLTFIDDPVPGPASLNMVANMSQVELWMTFDALGGGDFNPGVPCGNRMLPIPGQFFAAQNMVKFGRFGLDPIDHTILLFLPGMECCGLRGAHCPQFKEMYIDHGADNAVACNATIFSDVWPYPTGPYPGTSGQNAYERGALGQWRPQQSYAYKSPLHNEGKNFNTGWFQMDLFDWDHPELNNDQKWILTSEILEHSPDGQALEEVDALGIHSCAKYGYDRQLPYLVAQNATSAAVQFESFERSYGDAQFEDGLAMWGPPTALDATVAHSGKQSYRNSGSPGVLFSSKMVPAGDVPKNGLILRAWVRAKKTADPTFVTPVLQTTITDGTASTTIATTFVARSGEWALYESLAVPPLGWTQVRVQLRSLDGTGTSTWVDDVRLQPAESRMTSYVYDVGTFRLLASFDDQGFGLYYQYNEEGKLVRKLIETEKGIRTVQETQYHTPETMQHPSDPH